MMKRLLLLASALIAVIGCGQNQDGKGYTVVKEFPVEGTLEPVRVIHYDPVESNILALFRAGDWWISQNIQNYSGESGKCFSLLDGDFRTVVQFGTWGRGPQEFINASYHGYEGMKGDSIVITVRDWTMGRLIRLTAHTGDGGYRTELIQDFHKSMRAIHPLGQGRWLCNADNNRYYTTDSQGTVKTYLEGWGEGVNEALEAEITYQPPQLTSETVSPDRSRLLIYSITWPVLYLHSLDTGERLAEVYVDYGPDDIHSSNYSADLSYNPAEYLGHHIVGMINDEGGYSPVPSRIVIFDLDLKPEASYSIAPANYSAIDPATGILATISYNEETISLYDLSEWLN